MDNFLLPHVSIVILNYNGAKDSIDCLKSLNNISYNNYSIIVVDNASTDDSVNIIEEYLRSNSLEYILFLSTEEAMESDKSPLGITILQAGYNGGYGHGNNVGIKYALKNGADYILILNNDTTVDPGFLEPMVYMCENDKNIGIASGKVYFHDRPDVIWFNGGQYYPYTVKVEHVNFNEKDFGQKPPNNITFISGCLWLIPKNVFKKVGLINEEYFMYIEDLEFSQRVFSAGYKLQVTERSHIWHKVGSSTGGQYSRFSVYWRTKNMTKFLMQQNYNSLILLYTVFVFNIKFFIKLAIQRKACFVTVQAKAIIHGILYK